MSLFHVHLMPRVRLFPRRRRVNVHHYHHAAPKAAPQPTEAEKHAAALARLDRGMAKAGIRYAADGSGVEYIPGHRKAPKDTPKAAAKPQAAYSNRR